MNEFLAFYQVRLKVFVSVQGFKRMGTNPSSIQSGNIDEKELPKAPGGVTGSARTWSASVIKKE